MELNIGELINEKWKVEELFGESGQGQSARVSSVNNAEEKYVLKMLKDTGNSTSVKRFEQEICLLKKIQVY